jgi:hypothetical protein
MYTRTVPAPTQCTSLNGTTQYWVKTSPNKLTFTDDFVVDAYVKLSSYPTSTTASIASQFNGTSGWRMEINQTGQVGLYGINNGIANFSGVQTYQSVPLNKWVRITGQLDMSTYTATTTTSYIMLDGVDVPSFVSRGGTNPTALIQAGNLVIGADNTTAITRFFPGKIAQVAIYNAKVLQADIIKTHSQGLLGTETSLVSAYSFNGVATDLNTTTPNDLTAQAGAGYVADSPFGTQASGVPDGLHDYSITQSVSSNGLTEVVQVPEGCAIPTSGGISAISYSGLKSPYGFPSNANKWLLQTILKTTNATTSNAAFGSFISDGYKILTPIGSWKLSQKGNYYNSTTTTVYFKLDSAPTGTSDNIAIAQSSAAAIYVSVINTSTEHELTVATAFIMYTLGATTGAGIYSTNSRLTAENALL